MKYYPVLKKNIFPSYLFFLVLCFIISFFLFRLNVRIIWSGETGRDFLYYLSFLTNFSITSFAISSWFFENKYNQDEFHFGLLVEDFLKTTFKTFFISLISAAGITLIFVLLIAFAILFISILFVFLFSSIFGINLYLEVLQFSIFVLCLFINVAAFSTIFKTDEDNWPEDKIDEDYQYERHQKDDD